MSVVEEAAEPHLERGKTVHFDVDLDPEKERNQPIILRRPEIIHGLRNLVQNAVDFAAANVWIESGWTDERITLRIIDDGKGFSVPGSVTGGRAFCQTPVPKRSAQTGI